MRLSFSLTALGTESYRFLHVLGISHFFKTYVPVPVKMFPACVLAQLGWESPCKIKQLGLPELLEITASSACKAIAFPLASALPFFFQRIKGQVEFCSIVLSLRPRLPFAVLVHCSISSKELCQCNPAEQAVHHTDGFGY